MSEIKVFGVRVEAHGILRAFLKLDQAQAHAERIDGQVEEVTLREGQSVRVWSHTWEKRGKIVGFTGRSKVQVQVPVANGSKVQSFSSVDVVLWNNR